MFNGDTMVICEPSWTPGSEVQVIHRLVRIGQEFTACVYKIRATRSVDEHTVGLQTIKKLKSTNVMQKQPWGQDRVESGDRAKFVHLTCYPQREITRECRSLD